MARLADMSRTSIVQIRAADELVAPLADRSRTSTVQIRTSYFFKLGQIVGVKGHVALLADIL